MKAQSEAKRIPQLRGVTRPLGDLAGRPAKTVARPGPAGTFLAVAVLFLIAGVAVNVAFLIVGGFAAFGAVLMCFPAGVSEAGSHANISAISQRESWTERSMQIGTPEYNARWDE